MAIAESRLIQVPAAHRVLTLPASARFVMCPAPTRFLYVSLAMPSTTTPHIKDSKDPRATLDYGFDWTDWLGADSISTSVRTFEPGLTKVLATVSGAVTAI